MIDDTERMSFAPAILEAVEQADARHLYDILSRILKADRAKVVNTPSKNGVTPLVWAVTALHRPDIVGILLEAGAVWSSRILPARLTSNPQVLRMLAAAQDRTTLRAVCNLSAEDEAPRVRRRM